MSYLFGASLGVYAEPCVPRLDTSANVCTVRETVGTTVDEDKHKGVEG